MVKRYAEILAKGFLPTELVAPILRRHLEEQDHDMFSPANGNVPRILSRWENEQDRAEFHAVDALFCSLGIIHWWEPIREYYNMVNLDGVSRVKYCAATGCGLKLPEGKQKYCSETCARREQMRRYRAKHGIGRPEIAQGRGRHLTAIQCRNGHERTAENTTIGSKGERRCKICARKQSRDHARRKRSGSKVEV